MLGSHWLCASCITLGSQPALGRGCYINCMPSDILLSHCIGIATLSGIVIRPWEGGG